MKTGVSVVEMGVGLVVVAIGAGWVVQADRASGHLEATGIMHAAGFYLIGLGSACLIAGFHSWRRPERFWFAHLAWVGGYLVVPPVLWLLGIG